MMSIQELEAAIIEELPELYEMRQDAVDSNDGLWDYLEGTIEARLIILGRMGTPDTAIPKCPYTGGDC